VTEASEIQLLATDGHSFCAHVAFPDPVAPAPCVVLLHEIFGINSYMLAMAREFAAAGFVALIPDLFARQERDVNLAYEGPDFDHAIKLRDNLDFALALTDISAAVQWGRTTDRGNGAIAAVGYCLGGGLAFITAATADVDCAVSYYGLEYKTGSNCPRRSACHYFCTSPRTTTTARRRQERPSRKASPTRAMSRHTSTRESVTRLQRTAATRSMRNPPSRHA
jgi:dienelactone hydrolase